ncbi:UNVERIFIED_CONTAM: hypothetical protein Scaly_2944800 [Sesamum calycinum]|uniref:Reverse transcriptase zinc-binding domain-containing protein n=1 Tax=Sesamum calycinum TaxID=2727403 RepID=A0AAW2KX43_9LAMI
MNSEYLEDGLTDEDRRSLCVMPTLEEVREAVFSIDSDSVAGPDGFGVVFFHTCWEIVSKDVFGIVIEFFHGVEMPKGFTATTISLILKTASPTCWSAITVTKWFCAGAIVELNVLLAQELIHSLDSHRPKANVVLKLDMVKAYDRVQLGVPLSGLAAQVSALQTQAVQYVLGYQLKHQPVTYLGVPLYKGNRKVCLFDSIISRVRDMLQGEGSVSFWHDNWLGEKPLAQLLHRDTYTMEPAAGQGDKIVWMGSSAGDFSTKSAWEAIRKASPRRQLLIDAWHRFLRSTISVFLWRLFQDRIPVDARMRQKGFNFPSKCQCCEAEEKWNAANYHRVPFSINGNILEVQRHLRTLYAARTLTSTQWKGDLHGAAVMGFIFRQTVPRAPSIVHWRAPSPSWFKLNTGGSSFGNPGLAGAAGIIRDSAGHVHLAYQIALGIGASVLTELTAV